MRLKIYFHRVIPFMARVVTLCGGTLEGDSGWMGELGYWLRGALDTAELVSATTGTDVLLADMKLAPEEVIEAILGWLFVIKGRLIRAGG